MPHERLRPGYHFDQERIDALREIAPEAFADERGGIVAQCPYEGEGRPENVRAVFEEWANRSRSKPLPDGHRHA